MCWPTLDAPLLQPAAFADRRTCRQHSLLARAIAEEPCRAAARWRRDCRRASTRRSTSCGASPRNTDEFLLELEMRERERSGIAQLKLGYNRVQGFFIEIPRAHAERVPADYLRRQTVKSAERFITPELKRFEDEVLGARDKALAREKELYDARAGRTDRRACPRCRRAPRPSPAWMRWPALPQRADTPAVGRARARGRTGVPGDGRTTSGGRTVQRHQLRAQRPDLR